MRQSLPAHPSENSRSGGDPLLTFVGAAAVAAEVDDEKDRTACEDAALAKLDIPRERFVSGCGIRSEVWAA